MNWATALLAVLQALPELAKLGPDLVMLGQEFMTWLKHASGNDPQGYIKKVGQAFAQLNLAQTVEDRQNAAKAIADAIQGLP